jgi:DNA-binding NarL/FixJ family response regulator
MEDRESKMEPKDPLGLLLTDDMIFSSRITGTAKALGLKMIVVRSAKDLLVQTQECHPTCVIMDLSQLEMQIEELIRNLKEVTSCRPRLVAYGSHVDAATLRAAREAGCDLVLPRSQFVEELPRQLSHWLTLSGSSPTDQPRLEKT